MLELLASQHLSTFQTFLSDYAQPLFLQPINTGFSYSDDERDRVYDEDTVSLDMLDFLLSFMQGGFHSVRNTDKACALPEFFICLV